MKTTKENTIINKVHFDNVYKNVDVRNILDKLHNLNSFIIDATSTDTSWVGIYKDNFKESLRGKKVLELGCGDCTNLAVMAALGADVTGNDISQYPKQVVDKLNELYKFDYPIKFISGDFLDSKLEENEFDIVVGKAFVHHLTHEQEEAFLKLIVKYLKPDGIVRYFEPAINSKWLDNLRWLVPVPGRPSKLQKKKFEEWKNNDPHPDRDNSSNHYITIGKKYFSEVRIVPIGTIERFCRLLPGKWNRPLRRLSYKLEKLLPYSLNLLLTRSQLIEYRYPIK